MLRMDAAIAWRRGALQCGAAALLFGITTPLASQLTDEMNAPSLAGLLYVGAAIAVAPTLRRPRDAGSIRHRGGIRLTVAVVAGGFLGPLLLVAGLARTAAATASLLLNLELVATTLIAAAFFREHIGRRIAMGTLLVVGAGMALGWSEAPSLRVGVLFILAACLCWGIDNCVTADLGRVAPHEITAAKGLVAGATNLGLGVLLAGSFPAFGAVVAALILGAFGYGASITLWVTGARRLGAARAQLVFSAAPFVGALTAWVLLDEAATTTQAVALVVAACGALLVVGSDHEHPHEHAPAEHEHEHEHDDHHRHGHETHVARHAHPHQHEPLVHAHPHVPDLHHRHEHAADDARPADG